jgi:Tfp pilus assembly protein PilF
MKRAFWTSSLVLIAMLSITACRSAGGDLSKAETQRRFGVRMAKMNLWREAMFRFRRATEIEPANAMSHNNLAVAYEANGDFEAAGREYREALRLDRSNQHIQKNYSRYVEFTQRSRKREEAKPAPATAATATAPAATDTTATDTAATDTAATDTTATEAPVTDTTSTTTTNPPGEGAR